LRVVLCALVFGVFGCVEHAPVTKMSNKLSLLSVDNSAYPEVTAYVRCVEESGGITRNKVEIYENDTEVSVLSCGAKISVPDVIPRFVVVVDNKPGDKREAVDEALEKFAELPGSERHMAVVMMTEYKQHNSLKSVLLDFNDPEILLTASRISSVWVSRPIGDALITAALRVGEMEDAEKYATAIVVLVAKDWNCGQEQFNEIMDHVEKAGVPVFVVSVPVKGKVKDFNPKGALATIAATSNGRLCYGLSITANRNKVVSAVKDAYPVKFKSRFTDIRGGLVKVDVGVQGLGKVGRKFDYLPGPIKTHIVNVVQPRVAAFERHLRNKYEDAMRLHDTAKTSKRNAVAELILLQGDSAHGKLRAAKANIEQAASLLDEVKDQDYDPSLKRQLEAVGGVMPIDELRSKIDLYKNKKASLKLDGFTNSIKTLDAYAMALKALEYPAQFNQANHMDNILKFLGDKKVFNDDTEKRICLEKLKPMVWKCRTALVDKHVKVENYDEAVKVIDAYSASFGETPLVLERKGDVLVAAGKYEDAKNVYAKAMENSQSKSLVKKYTHAYLKTIREKKNIEGLLRNLEVHDFSSAINKGLADALEVARMYKALKSYGRAVDFYSKVINANLLVADKLDYADCMHSVVMKDKQKGSRIVTILADYKKWVSQWPNRDPREVAGALNMLAKGYALQGKKNVAARIRTVIDKHCPEYKQ